LGHQNLLPLLQQHLVPLWNAIFYLGKRINGYAKKEESSTLQTVIELCAPLQGLNHRIYMDNWYSSIPLFYALAKLQIWSTGTVRTNRKGLDKQVTIKKSEEKQLKKNPGTTRYSSYGSLVYAAWFDKRPVHMLTNCHDAEGSRTVQHWYSAKEGEAGSANGKILRDVFIPDVVYFYNLYMGAVDRFDQYRSYIKLEMRSNKFWHPMFWFIIESAVVNAWALYKASREKANKPLEYDHFSFRRSIAVALAAEWEAKGCTDLGVVSPTKIVKLKSQQFRTAVRGMNAVRSLDSDESDDRFRAPDCHLSYCKRIPATDGNARQIRQLICRQCKIKRSIFWCQKCFAPLCRGECYAGYHTKRSGSNSTGADK
jgi:hypothetical protein